MRAVPGIVIRRTLVLVFMVLLIWNAVVIGVSGMARAGNPEFALRISPTDSRALSNLADRLLIEPPTKDRWARANQLAQAALMNDPTNVSALRVLGFTAAQKDQLAIFAAANRLSRRDLATQLWLIDYHVGREDAARALSHYDAALRTSASASALLFPVLSAASGDQTLAADISKLLAKRPNWALPFLFELVNTSPSPDTLLAIFKHVDGSGTNLPPALASNLMRRMVRDYRFDLLPGAYAVAGGNDASVGTRVTNGGFSKEPDLLPFDWLFTSDENVYSGLQQSGATPDDYRLGVQATAGNAGRAARQLLLLAPGRYRLASKAGAVPVATQASLIWQINCATKAEDKIYEMPIPPAGDVGVMSKGEFSIPSAGCPAQWLDLRATAQPDRDGLEAWVDNVAVTRLN